MILSRLRELCRPVESGLPSRKVLTMTSMQRGILPGMRVNYFYAAMLSLRKGEEPRKRTNVIQGHSIPEENLQISSFISKSLLKYDQ